MSAPNWIISPFHMGQPTLPAPPFPKVVLLLELKTGRRLRNAIVGAPAVPCAPAISSEILQWSSFSTIIHGHSITLVG